MADESLAEKLNKASIGAGDSGIDAPRARLASRLRMALVLALGFASGLPRLLVGSTLGAWLKDSGLDMATVGLFALVAMPYSLKFLWAPALDHIRIPILARFGRRRSWMLLMQAAMAAMMLAMASLSPVGSPQVLAVLCIALAAISATFDTAFDAYRIEYLPKEEYGTGAAVTVLGYKIGMLAASGGALILADLIPWGAVYTAFAVVTLVLMGVVLMAPKESREAADKDAVRPAAKDFSKLFLDPFRQFMRSHAQWFAILLFVLLYRLPEAFAAFMTIPFLIEVGFSKTEIGTVTKLWGFGATVLGMALGGWLIKRYTVERCLIPCAIAGALTNLIYIGIAHVGPEIAWLVAGITTEHLFNGMATAVAIAYMMSLCDKEFAATQYALLSALVAVPNTMLSAFAGFVQESYGWSALFYLSMSFVVPALVVWRWARRVS